MTAAADGSAYREVPVFFDVGESTLFGIVTLPAEGVAHTGLVILAGAGAPFTVNRNRVSVRLGRRMAALGYATLRCDYHGAGDSTGYLEGFRLDVPFDADAAGAVACLRGFGVERVVLGGSCFGGRTALAAAGVDGVEALILIAASPLDSVRGQHKSARAAVSWGFGRYLREALRPRRIRGLFRRKSRRHYLGYASAKLKVTAAKASGRGSSPLPMGGELVSPRFEASLRDVIARGMPVLELYGAEDAFYEEYRAAVEGPLADVLPHAPNVELRELPGRLHGFITLRSQDAVIEEIVAWAVRRGATGPVASEPQVAASGPA